MTSRLNIIRATVLVVTSALVASGVHLCAQRRSQPGAVTIPGSDLLVRAGWLVIQQDGCRFAVPMTWTRRDSGTEFDGPSGSVFTVQRLHFHDWDEHVRRIRRNWGTGFAVRSDTSDRIWMERTHDDVTEDYEEVRLTDGSCCAILRHPRAVLSGTEATRIVEAVEPAR